MQKLHPHLKCYKMVHIIGLEDNLGFGCMQGRIKILKNVMLLKVLGKLD